MNPAGDFQADLRLARGGDREAFARLVKSHEPRLRRMTQSRLGDDLRGHVRTSDLLQSTFLEALKDLPALEDETEDGLAAWLRRILENNIRDRRKYVHALKRQAARATEEPAQSIDATRAKGPSPSGMAQAAEAWAKAQHAIRALPADYRAVLELRVEQDLSHKEIAERLGRSEGAVRVLLNRARAALREKLDGKGLPPT